MTLGWVALSVVLFASVAVAEQKKAIMVGATGADYTTIQGAVDAAPEGGAVIRIMPGTREVVHVDKPGIEINTIFGRNFCTAFQM